MLNPSPVYMHFFFTPSLSHVAKECLVVFLLSYKILEMKNSQIHWLKYYQQNLDESNIQLGPGGGTNRFSGWQRGSTGGGARNSMEQEKTNAPSNR